MCQKSAKTAKYNSLENFRLYGICELIKTFYILHTYTCNLLDIEEHKVGLFVDPLNVYGHSSCKILYRYSGIIV